MEPNEKSLSLRIDKDLWRKFRHVAKADRRSANKELLWLICQNIEEFEAEHGSILVGDEDA